MKVSLRCAKAAALAEGDRRTLRRAEIHRLEGNLRLAENGSAEAESLLAGSAGRWRGAGARSLELRAACDLARLWAGQGRRSEARDLLAPILWFSEGFDTADLKEAKTLLDELTEPTIAAERLSLMPEWPFQRPDRRWRSLE